MSRAIMSARNAFDHELCSSDPSLALFLIVDELFSVYDTFSFVCTALVINWLCLEW